jgi:glycosyltransferase involved in cell wall biosynthesis
MANVARTGSLREWKPGGSLKPGTRNPKPILMLSILIPVYNFDTRQLVADLVAQCRTCGIVFEILCFDDGSEEKFKKLHRESLPQAQVIYKELPQNIGRSAIRNYLGKSALYPWLLFMDCDSKVVRPDFIQKYVAHLAPGTLVYGGGCYAPTPPDDPALFFHWKYGTLREQMPAAQRRKTPYHSFKTNNFLVPKAVFLATGFDETLRQYGHEDTLFGLELARREVPILHIGNPLEHLGLEPVEVFLAKTRQGLENLHTLLKRGAPIETTLLRAWNFLKKSGLKRIFILVYRMTEPIILKQLESDNPRLLVFDIFKLGYFASTENPESPAKKNHRQQT